VFEQYLFDAKNFLDEARQAEASSDEAKSKRLFRSSIWHLSAAVESYLNTTSQALDRTKIDPLLIAYLQDKAYVVKPSSGNIATRTEYHSVDERFKLLATLYHCDLPFQDRTWNDFILLKTLRDELTHPKGEEDSVTLARYEKVSSSGLTAVLKLLNLLNQKIFGRVFRKTLRELND
jgi:hypothetical protein